MDGLDSLSARLLILGDSLTFARPAHRINFDDTWPAFLEGTGYRVHHRGQGGINTSDLRKSISSLVNYWAPLDCDEHRPFAFCVIQVGIVDCTPRLLSAEVGRLLDQFPVGARIKRRLSRNRMLNSRFGRPWTSLNSFAANILDIDSMLARVCDRVLWVEIAPPCRNLLRNAGDFTRLVEAYNSELEKVAGRRLVKPYRGRDAADFILEDGHHLNADGHRLVAESVSRVLQDD